MRYETARMGQTRIRQGNLKEKRRNKNVSYQSYRRKARKRNLQLHKLRNRRYFGKRRQNAALPQMQQHQF